VLELEKLHRLLFELSSKERMDILMRLRDNSLKLTEISRSQNLSPPEASRHLQRMSEDLLIKKDEDGRYHLTSYGGLVLSQIPVLDFISNNNGYFSERDCSGIPYEFIGRMGELLKAEYYGEPADGLNNIERILNDAREFIYFTSNKIVTSITPHIARKIGRDFDLKTILPKATIDMVASDHSIPLGLQMRFSENVDVLVIATDRISGFGLPDRNGKFDYSGFMGTDPKLKKWCKDLFQHYWDRAREAKS
jgi:predicted transcriptional regulator